MTLELERNKQLVRRLMDEAINDDNLAVLDEVCTERLATELQRWFSPFRAGFPDWRQEIIELVAESGTVVARCRCLGTNLGEWLGVPATGRSMEVDEVWFFTVAEDRLDGMWSLEDTWLGSCSSERQNRRFRQQDVIGADDQGYSSLSALDRNSDHAFLRGQAAVR